MPVRKCFSVCLFLALLPFITSAQESFRLKHPTSWAFRADDALHRKLYRLAAQDAQLANQADYVGTSSDWISYTNRNRFVSVLGRLESDAPHALDTALAALPAITERPYHDRLSLAIARYYFLKEKLVEAIPFYEAAGIANFNNIEIADAKFELAYCYFNNRQFAAASNLFAIMKEVPGKYYNPGNYYYGLLAYNEGDFKGALSSFDKIKSEPIYKPVVPYYIAELYYYMGQRDKALAAALKLIGSNEKQYYENELHLLVAQCLFEAERYGDALPYFETYYKHTDKIRKEELYEMGYSYYRVNEWASAIAKFKPLSSSQDSLGQTAMYLLGDCYLHVGEKENARNAFGICAAMLFNRKQREAALLLHSKLCYELGYADEAMNSVNTLLTDYPSSSFRPEAKSLQSQLYIVTNNYKEAYNAILEGDGSNKNNKEIKQRAAYGYAMQLVQAQDIAAADKLIDVVLANRVDAGYNAAAQFWKSELSYRLHQYQTAADNAKAFLNNEGDQSLAEAISPAATRAHASLNLGYASLELKDFKEAQQAFALAKASGRSATTQADASVREADALFMQKDYTAAATIYTAQMKEQGRVGEYARMQSAIIAGLKGDNAEKKALLMPLVVAVPASEFTSEARYELGNVLFDENKYNEAIASFQPLVAERNSGFSAKALLKIGTAQQQLGQENKALESYTSVLQDWLNTPERADALQAIKSIYISRNQPDSFSYLLQHYKLPAMGEEEQSRTYYNAAEAQYANGNWAASEAGFSKYLNLYPQAVLAYKAKYYLGNAQYNQRKYKAALVSYESVLANPWAEFSDEAVRRAAEISFADSNYAMANTYYQLMKDHAASPVDRTVALTGLMRTTAQQGDMPRAAQYADTLLASDTGLAVEVKDEARMYRLRTIISDSTQQNAASALIAVLKESTNNTVAAEARYYAAQRLLVAGKLKEAEAAASTSIKKSAGVDYWVVKTYILLGDILMKEKDFFNARATLQSVAQHATNPRLKEEAKRKLDELKSIESTKLSNE